jgi:hypothetical protein
MCDELAARAVRAAVRACPQIRRTHGRTSVLTRGRGGAPPCSVSAFCVRCAISLRGGRECDQRSDGQACRTAENGGEAPRALEQRHGGGWWCVWWAQMQRWGGEAGRRPRRTPQHALSAGEVGRDDARQFLRDVAPLVLLQLLQIVRRRHLRGRRAGIVSTERRARSSGQCPGTAPARFRTGTSKRDSRPPAATWPPATRHHAAGHAQSSSRVPRPRAGRAGKHVRPPHRAPKRSAAQRGPSCGIRLSSPP